MFVDEIKRFQCILKEKENTSQVNNSDELKLILGKDR